MKNMPPDRKIEVLLLPQEGMKDTPFHAIVLEWSNNPVYLYNDTEQEDIVPGTEHGSWYNPGIANVWAKTPEEAFAEAMKQYKADSKGLHQQGVPNCPKCGEKEKLQFRDFEGREDGEATQEGECLKCSCRWQDVFTLAKTNILKFIHQDH